MLEHEKGFIRIWLPSEHLEFFFEKVNPVERACPIEARLHTGQGFDPASMRG